MGVPPPAYHPAHKILRLAQYSLVIEVDRCESGLECGGGLHRAVCHTDGGCGVGGGALKMIERVVIAEPEDETDYLCSHGYRLPGCPVCRAEVAAEADADE